VTSEARNEATLGRLVGRCVGCRPGRDWGIWLWADVAQVQATPYGCRLWVVHPMWHGSGRWVAGRDVRTRTKRDAAILDEANNALSRTDQ